MRLAFLMGMSLLGASDPPPLGRMVDLGGRRLHLNCEGAGAPTVIVENGGGGSSVEWALVQPRVAKSTRICTYDRAGYGWSDRGPVDDGIEQIVSDLNLLLRTARIDPPYVLVGQSLGALFVRAYQRRYPEQVVGLVLVDGSPDEDVRMVMNGKREPIARLTAEQLPEAFAEYRKGLPVLKAGRADAPPLDRLPAALQQARQWAFEKMVREMGFLPNTMATAESWRQEFGALRRQRLSGRYPLGPLPLRVIEREKDANPVWHEQQVETAGLSSEGRLIKGEGAGHMIHLENPELVGKTIVEVVEAWRRR